MHFRTASRWLAALCLAAGAAAAQENSEASLATIDPVAEDTALIAYLDGLMATWQTVHGAPGYTVAVVRPERTVAVKGYGLADVAAGVAVDPATTRFHIASISKTFVWTAVMMLAERGVLALDVDVNAYLDRYTVPDAERPLTLADLMGHRAGFEDNFDLFSTRVAAMELPQAIAASQPKQAFARGTVMAYSNWGSNLAALIIEDATGSSYADFLQEEILNPLGMTTTALTEDSPAARNPASTLAKNYQVVATGPKEVPQLDLGSFAPVAGMTTTAADMARWLRFHLGRGVLDGVRLLSEQSYSELRTRTFDPVPGAAGRAHGFADLPFRSTHYYGHTGSINDFLSKFAVAPELGLGVFIAQNSANQFDPLNFVPLQLFDRELQRKGLSDLTRPRPIPSDSDVEEAQALAGTYITSRRMFHGPQKLFALFDGVVELQASDGYLLGMRPHSPYVRIAPDVWENRYGDRLAFIRDSSGEVERLISPAGDTEYEPVSLLTSPMLLLGSLAATVLFALTTWLGLWRRFRQQVENRTVGRVLGWLALAAIAPLVWLAVLAGQIASVEEASFAEIMVDWPPPLLLDIALAATVAAGVGALMLLCILPAWALSGWNLVRKIHFSLYGMAYGALGLSFVIWGLAPYLP